MPKPSENAYPDADRREVVKYIPVDAQKILDVGCWRGAFGAELKRQRPSVEVVGVEPNESAAAIASQRLDRVIAGRFPDDVHGGPFDCVVFNDVLEHFEDPWDALRSTAKLLCPGGRVVAVIPNVRHVRVTLPLVLAGRWEYMDTGILDRTHLRFFTRSSMLDLFETSGYDVELITPMDVSDVGIRGAVMRVLLSPLGRENSIGLRAMRYGIVAVSKPTIHEGPSSGAAGV